jgi:hypothetical protein
MKALTLLSLLIVSTHCLAQGYISPDQQNQIMEEAKLREPATADISPEQASEILEKLKKGKEVREAQTQFIEELDKEN